jgi:hypothetical protein
VGEGRAGECAYGREGDSAARHLMKNATTL